MNDLYTSHEGEDAPLIEVGPCRACGGTLDFVSFTLRPLPIFVQGFLLQGERKTCCRSHILSRQCNGCEPLFPSLGRAAAADVESPPLPPILYVSVRGAAILVLYMH